jgi:hypothetical protein
MENGETLYRFTDGAKKSRAEALAVVEEQASQERKHINSRVYRLSRRH